MEINTVAQLITSVGFPIVAAIGMFYYLTKIMDKRDEKMDATLKSMTDVVNENNKVITVFTEKIDLLFKIIESDKKGGADDGR